jgi:8-oxo-dGTP pyrophosphatase MutT (NUDIX family)
MDEGLVQKNKDSYSLTTEGKKLADRMSLHTFTKRVQPKIATLVIFKRKEPGGKKEILFCKKGKQPFFGYTTLPTGKIHLGEKMYDAARRELFEKTGLPADNIFFIGDVYVILYKNGELFSHILYHIFEGDSENEIFGNVENTEDCFWMEASKTKKMKCVPGIQEIIEIASQKNKGIFFQEIALNF